MKIFLITVFLFGCAGAERTQGYNENPLAGTWTYVECTIKNTSVRGTATFKNNGTLVLDIRARDDYPVPDNLRGTYHYTVKGGRIETDYKGGYGMEDYFYISGDMLYLSRSLIEHAVNDPMHYSYNWSYRLKRVK